MIAALVYTLCAITSLVCAVLLGRGYLRSRTGLLLWSTFCFIGLTINNILLVVDRVLFTTQIDLYMLRLVCATISVALLVYGLLSRVDQ